MCLFLFMCVCVGQFCNADRLQGDAGGEGSSQHVVVNPRNVTLCFAVKVCVCVCVLAGALKTTLYLLVCCLATLHMCPSSRVERRLITGNPGTNMREVNCQVHSFTLCFLFSTFILSSRPSFIFFSYPPLFSIFTSCYLYFLSPEKGVRSVLHPCLASVLHISFVSATKTLNLAVFSLRIFKQS